VHKFTPMPGVHHSLVPTQKAGRHSSTVLCLLK
jgi:hypothetical protein